MVSTMPVTREEMIQRATALVPRLRERAERTEQLRRLSDETIADLFDAGLFRIGTPDRFGGPGLDVDTMYEVTLELGRGCGSTAWCYSVLAGHNWMLGHWPEQGQEEYFADHSTYAPYRALAMAPYNFKLSRDVTYLENGAAAGIWWLELIHPSLNEGEVRSCRMESSNADSPLAGVPTCDAGY